MMLLLPITLSVMGIVVLVPIVPQLMTQFSSVPGYPYLVLGGILTMPALCVTLFSPLAGWLADRFGRRPILIVSMIAYAVIGIAPIFLDSLFAIIATRVGVGLCEAVIMTVTTTLIADYFESPARERWLASQTATASLSAIALMVIGGQLGHAFGWRGPFGVYLFSLVLVAGVILFTWEPAHVSAETANPATGPMAEFPWARMLGICAITLFASVMFYTVQTQVSLALKEFGIVDADRVGNLAALASLGVPIGTIGFRGLVRIPVGVLFFVEFGIIGGSFIWMGHAGDFRTFLIATACNQIGCGMILPTLLTWAVRGLAFEVRGRGNGLWQGTFAVGQFLSGIVVTFLAARAGGLLAAFVALGISNVAAAVLAFGAHLRYRARCEFTTA